jgi:hypothetical protein
MAQGAASRGAAEATQQKENDAYTMAVTRAHQLREENPNAPTNQLLNQLYRDKEFVQNAIRVKPDVIVVPAGVYKIAIAGAGDDANLTGDLDITGSLTIQGAGAGKTIIDGQQLDRVFDVIGTAPHSIRVVLQGLTVRNGNVTGGGGGVQVGNADLVVRDCVVVIPASVVNVTLNVLGPSTNGTLVA